MLVSKQSNVKETTTSNISLFIGKTGVYFFPINPSASAGLVSGNLANYKAGFGICFNFIE